MGDDMTFISKHRGYSIFRIDDGSYVANGPIGDNIGGGFDTAWSAIIYIDELLSP